VCHLNEGHAAFAVLERARCYMEDHHRPFDVALTVTRAGNLFTTHTPVAAGFDRFDAAMIVRYLKTYAERELSISVPELLVLGRSDSQDAAEPFNMAYLAIRGSGAVNGVSRLHGQVSRRIFQPLFPRWPEREVPVTHVTNGVHTPTWVAQELDQLYGRYLGPDWVKHHDSPALWRRVYDIPDEELWHVRVQLKHKLMSFIRERARDLWRKEYRDPVQVLASGALLDPAALTLGFARRFATYKRATLLLQDLARLQAIMQDRWRPVQIIFAGKAHPADEPGKHLIHQVYALAKEYNLGGQIAFVEDYDMHVAKFLVQGVDVWLNNPTPPLEASGTSGQKAALNGVPNLSVADGWWYEGYNGGNGWTIRTADSASDPAGRDSNDARSLYQLLENEIVPLYYQRDSDGVPRGWIRVVKEAICSITPLFSARRMVKEYVERFYVPAAREAGDTSTPSGGNQP